MSYKAAFKAPVAPDFYQIAGELFRRFQTHEAGDPGSDLAAIVEFLTGAYNAGIENSARWLDQDAVLSQMTADHNYKNYYFEAAEEDNVRTRFAMKFASKIRKIMLGV